MKSLFKRSIAAATSSVLALTQLALIANVNISAVDTADAAATASASGVDVSIDTILNVPVQADDFTNAKLEDGMALVGRTDLGSKLEAQLLASGDKQFSVSPETVKNRAKNVLTTGGYFTAAEIDEIAAQISNADVKITSEGTATVTISLADVGPTVGPAFERFVSKLLKIDFNDPDAPIAISWDGFKIAGKLVIEAKADFDKNTATYTTTITDETGKALASHEALVEYAVAKLDAAANNVMSAAKKTLDEKQAELDDYKAQKNAKQAELDEKVKELDQAQDDKDAAQADKNDAQADLDKAKEDGADAAAVAEKQTELDDAQAKLDDAQAKLNDARAKAADAQKQLDDAQVKLDEAQAQADDARDKLAKATDLLNNGKNKFRENALKAVEAVEKITEQDTTLDGLYASYIADLEAGVKTSTLSAKRQNQVINQIEKKTPETALAAFDNEKVQAAYEKAVNGFNNKYGDIATISVSLDDIKGVIENAEAQTKDVFKANYEVDGYSANAVLYIDDDAQQADLIAAATEAMTPEEFYKAGWTVVLDEEDGTPVTEFEGKEYEIIKVVAKKKITASADTQYLLNGTLGFDVERIVTQIVVKEIEETTTTTTTTTTQESTTTTTTTSETSGESTTTTSETTTDNGQGDTTTTAATYVSFEIKGVEDEGLIYWSEEDTEFDLSDLSITLRVFEGGVATDLNVDVTGAFELAAKSPAELEDLPEGAAISAKKVFFVLKNPDAVISELTKAGYGEDLIEQEGIKEGYEAGNLIVYLVLRGDTKLDGNVDLDDAQYALDYYTSTVITELSAKDLMTKDGFVYLKNKATGSEREAYFPFSHYAADVNDGDGVIDLSDAQQILIYYTAYTVTELKSDKASWWDDDLSVGKHVTPREELHANPLVRDSAAKDYVDREIDHSVAEEA